MFMTIFFQFQSFCIFSLMIYGVSVSRKRKWHIKIMTASMIWDLLLILQLQYEREAVQGAIRSFTVFNYPLWIHLFFACCSLILYIVMISLGRSLLGGKREILKQHRFFGWVTLSFRFLTFVTSFFVI